MTVIYKLPRDWINENVEQLDAPVLDMGDVRACDGRGAIGRTRPPEKSCGAIVAHSASDGDKDKVGWQHAVQAVNSSRDRIPSGRDGLGVAEGCVLGVEFAQCRSAAVRVSLVENAHDIGLHQCVDIDPVCGPYCSGAGLLLRTAGHVHDPSKSCTGVDGARQAPNFISTQAV